MVNQPLHHGRPCPLIALVFGYNNFVDSDDAVFVADYKVDALPLGILNDGIKGNVSLLLVQLRVCLPQID